MNASEWINSLCDWIEREIDHVEAGGRGRSQPYTREMVRLGRLAAAREEQERKVLTDEEIERVSHDLYPDTEGPVGKGRAVIREYVRTALRYARDNGYLSPAPFDVEGFVDDVVRMVDENLEPRRTDVLGHDVISGKMRFRKALEAHAEKIGSETPGSVLD